jgi:Rap1a immunity proteins
MRILLALCLVLFSTAGFAETAKPLVDDCRADSPKFSRNPGTGRSEGRCLGIINTMMSIGPYLPKHMKFCPGTASPVFGVDVVNGYFKAHPEANPEGDAVAILVVAFREEWPCK